MTRTLAAALLLFTAVGARAAGDHELLAAEQELKIAKDHLAAAGTEYQGHRRAAIQLIDQALQELRKARVVSRPGRPEGKSGPAGQSDDD